MPRVAKTISRLLECFETWTEMIDSDFPDDENGDVLRRMRASGDDLAIARDIDFTVVLPDRDSAVAFGSHYERLGLAVRIEQTRTVAQLPWDVVVTRNMVPTHQGIESFENDLQRVAVRFGGRNDGWGCFQQD